MQVLPPSSTGGPSRLFIMRPVATTLLMVAILLAGIIGYRALPVSALPEVDYPTIQVVTLYPGASPDVMLSLIHISEPTRQAEISYAVFCLKKKKKTSAAKKIGGSIN